MYKIHNISLLKKKGWNQLFLRSDRAQRRKIKNKKKKRKRKEKWRKEKKTRQKSECSKDVTKGILSYAHDERGHRFLHLAAFHRRASARWKSRGVKNRLVIKKKKKWPVWPSPCERGIFRSPSFQPVTSKLKIRSKAAQPAINYHRTINRSILFRFDDSFSPVSLIRSFIQT